LGYWFNFGFVRFGVEDGMTSFAFDRCHRHLKVYNLFFTPARRADRTLNKKSHPKQTEQKW
jgi:hypothetical protein